MVTYGDPEFLNFVYSIIFFYLFFLFWEVVYVPSFLLKVLCVFVKVSLIIVPGVLHV